MPNEGHRIFEITALPLPENVLWVSEGGTISVGDFGWENDVSSDLIHLTGYSKNGGTVWHANFLPAQLRFTALKPPTMTPPWTTPYVTQRS